MRRTETSRGGATPERVEELKRLVESGGYRPDPSRIAQAMISCARRNLAARRLDGHGHA
jgi:anti-sigma28 factor (negative regulator of flagellin synthesis)